MEVNSLHLNVKSDSVRRSADRLERLSRSSAKAEKESKRFGAEADKATKATEKYSGATTRLKDAKGRFVKAEGKATKSVSAFGVAAKGSAVVATAVATAVASGTKEWLAFNEAMLEVSTIVDVSAAEMEQLREGVLGVSAAMGTDATEGARALYQAISAGVPQDNAIDFLGTASGLAIAGMTDTATAVDGLTNVINAFKLDTADAGEVADDLFTAVKLGKTTVAELSSNLSKASVSSKALGISHQELLANFIAITKQGTQSSEAFTQMNALTTALVKPTKELEAAYATLGVESAATAIEQDGLATFLGKLTDHFGGNQTAMVKALSSTEAYKAALATTGENAKDVAASLEELSNNTGAADEATEKASQKISVAWNKVKNSIQLVNEQLGIMAATNGFIVDGLDGVAFAIKDLLLVQKETPSGINAQIQAFEILAKNAEDITEREKEMLELFAFGNAELEKRVAHKTRFVGLNAEELKAAKAEEAHLEWVRKTEEEIFGEQERAAEATAKAEEEQRKATERRTKELKDGLADVEKLATEINNTEVKILDAKIAQIEAARTLKDLTADQAKNLDDALTKLREMRLEAAITEQGGELAPTFGELHGPELPPSFDPKTGRERVSRSSGGRATELQTFGGLASSLGLDTDVEGINERFERQREAILEAQGITEEQRTELMVRSAEDRAARLADLENAQTTLLLSTSQQQFAGLAEQAKAFGGEQSAAYKAMFAVSKGFAIAESVLAMQQNIAQASKIGFPQNIPLIAGAAAQGVSIISNVRAVAGNFANGGIVGGSSFTGDALQANVNSGEVVLNFEQQRRLLNIANGASSGGHQTGGSGNVTIINQTSTPVEAETRTNANGDREIIIREAVNRTKAELANEADTGGGAVVPALQRNFGLRRTGA